MALAIAELLGLGTKVLEKFIPDPAQRAQAEGELRAHLIAWDAAQAKINAVEAVSTNLFVSGWRPWIGWVCGVALAYQYVLTPIAVWLTAMAGIDLPAPPKLDDALWQLMTGMLGIAGLRTFEKIKGVSAK
ncbi:MAG: 3TM-type holin [Gallionella sp.]